jgi:hypothetical protein
VAELTPIPSIQRPSDPGYQPVSGYAVAAIVIAGVFLVILIGLLLAAAFSKRTAMWLGLLVLPLTSWVLAILARSHIRNSEGTRTGARLASLAWWISVLGGVGFLAYLIANYFALKMESQRASDAFLNELQNGRPRHAFYLYVLPAEERGRGDPNVADGSFEAGYAIAGYPHFKNHELVRLLVRNGSSAEVEHVGVKDLDQVASGFQATHMYRVTCPEGEFSVQVKLVAIEARTGAKSQAQWRIPSDPTPNMTLKPDRVSTYGRLVIELEQEGVGYANLWMLHQTAGRTTLAQLMTTPPEHRKSIEESLAWGSMLGGPQAVLISFRPEFLPPERRDVAAKAPEVSRAFEDLAQTGFFRADETGAPLPSERLSRLRTLWPTVRIEPSTAVRQVQMAQVPPDMPVISLKPDVITVVIGAEIVIDSMHFAKCSIAVECRDPAVLAAVKAARDKGATDTDVVTLKSLPSRGWRVAWLRTDMEPISVATASGRMMPP